MKSFLTFIALIVIVTFVVGFLDPFQLGLKYMGEGLPMAFSMLFAWFMTFKLWAYYHILFFYKKTPTNLKKELGILLGIILVFNIINVAVDPFHTGPVYIGKGNGGISLFAVSMLGTSLCFGLWVFYQYIFGSCKAVLERDKNALYFLGATEFFFPLTIILLCVLSVRWDGFFGLYTLFTTVVALVWWLIVSKKYQKVSPVNNNFEDVLDS